MGVAVEPKFVVGQMFYGVPLKRKPNQLGRIDLHSTWPNRPTITIHTDPYSQNQFDKRPFVNNILN